MATTFNFKRGLDIPAWRPLAPLYATSAAGACVASDLRNDDTNLPRLYYLRSAAALDCYDWRRNDWLALGSPSLAGTFGAGTACVLHPTQGPKGTIAAGATNTTITLSTALPAAVGNNQLANRGDGSGFRIRIIGNTAGGSGKTEVRNIVANTAGTTPQIVLDSALSFVPAAGSTYELLSGKVYMLNAGVQAVGSFRSYDIATSALASLAFANLPATVGTDSAMLAFSELYVPLDRKPGEGMFAGGSTYDGGGKTCIAATAVAATTITGSGMPALFADEYRNFQIRIVEDAVNPTAVGQRRRISTHTSGASAVFTVSTAWTVNPSTSAKFVVENDDDKLLLRSTATALAYTYNIATNAWDTTTWAAPVAHGAGVVLAQNFGITRDVTGNSRHSHVYCVRGGASNAIDVLDIAGAANGSWSNDIWYGSKSQTFTTGTCGAHDPVTTEGKYLHLSINGTQRFAAFDMQNRVLEAGSYLPFPQGAALVGGKLGINFFIDGAAKLPVLHHVLNTSLYFMQLVIPI